MAPVWNPDAENMPYIWVTGGLLNWPALTGSGCTLYQPNASLIEPPLTIGTKVSLQVGWNVSGATSASVKALMAVGLPSAKFRQICTFLSAQVVPPGVMMGIVTPVVGCVIAAATDENDNASPRNNHPTRLERLTMKTPHDESVHCQKLLAWVPSSAAAVRRMKTAHLHGK